MIGLSIDVSRRAWRNGRWWRCAVAVAVGCSLTVDAARAQTATADRQVAQLAAAQKLFEDTIAAAERACLSNHAKTETAQLTFSLQTLVDAVKSGVGVARKTVELRGASQQLPAIIQQSENTEIRNCMSNLLLPVYGSVVAVYEEAVTNAVWPDPIDFRFNYARAASKEVQKYSSFLRLNLARTSKSPLSRRITNQFDPSGAPYFQYDISYPATGEVIRGTITPEMNGDARLSTEQPIITEICLQRPASLPAARSDYDLFDCVEGGVCRPAMMSTGWLGLCPQKSGRMGDPSGTSPYLRRVAFPSLAAAPAQSTQPPAGAARWVVPSLEALTERNVEGVGYTIFTIETEAFRRRGIIGVEFAVAVNGTPVHEDALRPEQRPLANDPASPFSHSFALQTLDFQGAQGGCDRIEIGLTPLLADGRKGEARTTLLSYVALRDVEKRRQQLGDGEMSWTASYITPAREWRNIPIVHSYIYRLSDGGARDEAVRRVEADKRWIDQQGLTYEGQRVVGVIRPPRTVQADGTAAFGLGIGLLQANGQVRFTFADGDARSIAGFMIGRREKLPGASKLIAPEPYIFQAVGGSRTVTGVCEKP